MSAADVFLSPGALLDHWQGHRRLTRRVIEVFPDDKFATFSVGGMRPFRVMSVELLRMAVPTVRGILNGDWSQSVSDEPHPKADVLRLWDEGTKDLNDLWARIPATRFQETVKAFGQYEGRACDLIMYVVDNEIHHRGQGYVYLRALGIEPPHFWERK
jgi:uncharacterized damage-inducible protein DinB